MLLKINSSRFNGKNIGYHYRLYIEIKSKFLPSLHIDQKSFSSSSNKKPKIKTFSIRSDTKKLKQRVKAVNDKDKRKNGEEEENIDFEEEESIDFEEDSIEEENINFEEEDIEQKEKEKEEVGHDDGVPSSAPRELPVSSLKDVPKPMTSEEKKRILELTRKQLRHELKLKKLELKAEFEIRGQELKEQLYDEFKAREELLKKEMEDQFKAKKVELNTKQFKEKLYAAMPAPQTEFIGENKIPDIDLNNKEEADFALNRHEKLINFQRFDEQDVPPFSQIEKDIIRYYDKEFKWSFEDQKARKVFFTHLMTYDYDTRLRMLKTIKECGYNPFIFDDKKDNSSAATRLPFEIPGVTEQVTPEPEPDVSEDEVLEKEIYVDPKVLRRREKDAERRERYKNIDEETRKKLREDREIRRIRKKWGYDDEKKKKKRDESIEEEEENVVVVTDVIVVDESKEENIVNTDKEEHIVNKEEEDVIEKEDKNKNDKEKKGRKKKDKDKVKKEEEEDSAK